MISVHTNGYHMGYYITISIVALPAYIFLLLVGIYILYCMDRLKHISSQSPSLPNVLLSVYGICLVFLLPRHQSVEWLFLHRHFCHKCKELETWTYPRCMNPYSRYMNPGISRFLNPKCMTAYIFFWAGWTNCLTRHFCIQKLSCCGS